MIIKGQNKKLCFVFISHGRIHYYKEQAYFFKKFKNLKKEDYDIIIYDNSTESRENVLDAIKDFEVSPKAVFTQMPNQGYFLGAHFALNDTYDLYKEYDYVVHLLHDVLIINDQHLYDWLQNLDDCKCGLLTNQFGASAEVYATDFFVFKPQMLNKDFWEKVIVWATIPKEQMLKLFPTIPFNLSLGNMPPELVMRVVTDEFKIPVLIWTRMHHTVDGRVLCNPTPEQLKGYRYRSFVDTAGLLHTHDIEDLEKYK